MQDLVLYFISFGGFYILLRQRKYLCWGRQTLESGLLQGRIYQDAFYLLFFALFGIVVAVMFNWKNSKLGYWLNLVVISVGDIGFIITVLMPGYIPLFPGSLGPILWLIALTLTTISMLKRKTRQAQE